MIRTRLAVWTAFFLVFAARAEGETLSWRACVEEAGRNNPQIRSAAKSLDAARFDKNAAYSSLFPQISGDFDYSKSNRASTVVGSLTPSFYSFSLTARQNLFSGFRTLSAIGVGQASEDIARETLRDVRASVSYDLKSSFADIRYAQDFSALTREIQRRRQDNRNLVELRFESGRENKGSLLLARAYFQDANYDRLQADNALETARRSLARALGRDSAEGIIVAGNVPVTKPVPLSDPEGALEKTPAYRRAVDEKRLAWESIRNARANFLPTIDVSAAFGWQGDTWLPSDDRWSIGLNLSIPLFSGGQDFFQLQGAKARWAAAGFDQKTVELDLRRGLVASYKAYENAVAKLDADRAFLEAARVRAEIARSKYDNGLISFEDWDIIENDLINRQKTYLISQRNRVLAEADWERTRGVGVLSEEAYVQK